MRKLHDLAALTAILGLPLLLAVTVPRVATAAAPGALPACPTPDCPPGMQVLLALKCNLCHSVQSVGIERKSKSEKTMGPDLSTIGAEHDAAWLARWQRQEVANAEGKKHEKAFKGTPEQLAELTEWLATLKKK
jgi:hypothetical protein